MSQSKEISIKDIKKRWHELFDVTHSFNLYIDIPFCISVCKFCNLGKIEAKVNSPEYKKYFEVTLPRFFEEQDEILRLKTFDTLYFGGGTSGLMDTKTMRKVFNMIPDITKIGSKKFEANPTLLSDEKIEILAEYGFNQISLGVQSFNDDLIIANNRVPVKLSKLQHIVELCHKYNISVNCDLLTFTEQSGYPYEIIDINKSLENTRKDLQIMIEQVTPDIITVYPKWEMFSFKDGEFIEGTELRDLDLKYKINKMILRTLRKHTEYEIIQANVDLKLDNKVHSDAMNNVQMRLKDNKNVILDKYDSSSYPFNKGNNQNVVALGGYGGLSGRCPYSYIEDKFYYMNIVEGNDIKYVHIFE